MHIMHVIDSLAVGGAERMVVEIANRTAADGWPVSVCITRSDCTLGKVLAKGIPLFVLGRRRRWDWGAMNKFGALIKEQRVEVLQVHGRFTLSFLSIVWLLGLIRVPTVFLDHHGEVEIDTSIPFWFKWLGKHSFSQYVGVSEKLGDWARTVGIAPDKILVIENGLDLHSITQVDPVDLRKEYGIAPDTLIGIAVGGWRREKGLDVLIEAVCRSSFRDRFKILVVGGVRDQGYVQECRNLIDAHGLGDTFLFLGQRTDVISLLKGADFAIMASRFESGPLSLIEYLACALPVVSTEVGAIARQASRLGLPDFVPPDDAGALAQALDRLLSLSKDERLARGRQGLEICLEHFDIRGKMPLWYKVYEEAASKKKAL
jgi:glycosyltransferase involved in cell wall biosynthesis